MKSLKAIYSRTTASFVSDHFWQNKQVYSSENFENLEN
ncbi:hypothetical protein T4B_9791 [Trichinella pseudospiralis]|uniref:Uncharacterized protein n=1 Tax=Trichinella pseudospiralis TaxID=6337 RepID=A0A0V1GA28_TRIPS|nr:hypothetical protein T4B_9791 [Trichinella pseudospiralis]